jgi:hypothetical protein
MAVHTLSGRNTDRCRNEGVSDVIGPAKRARNTGDVFLEAWNGEARAGASVRLQVGARSFECRTPITTEVQHHTVGEG